LRSGSWKIRCYKLFCNRKIVDELLWPVQEHLNDEVAPFGVVEEDKKTPVNEPGALLQHLQGVGKSIGINVLSQLVQVLQGGVPVLYQDLRSQFSPKDVEIIL